jgi:hypothetical protein
MPKLIAGVAMVMQIAVQHHCVATPAAAARVDRNSACIRGGKGIDAESGTEDPVRATLNDGAKVLTAAMRGSRFASL